MAAAAISSGRGSGGGMGGEAYSDNTATGRRRPCQSRCGGRLSTLGVVTAGGAAQAAYERRFARLDDQSLASLADVAAQGGERQADNENTGADGSRGDQQRAGDDQV